MRSLAKRWRLSLLLLPDECEVLPTCRAHEIIELAEAVVAAGGF